MSKENHYNAQATQALKDAYQQAAQSMEEVEDAYRNDDHQDPHFIRMDQFLNSIDNHLRQNANPNVVVEDEVHGETTLLKTAVECVHFDAVNHLLNDGAYIQFSADDPRDNAFEHIRSNRSEHTIDDAAYDRIYDRLLQAADAQHFDFHAKAVAAGLMHAAVTNVSAASITKLYERGLDVNARDSVGDTPLHSCSQLFVTEEIYSTLLDREPYHPILRPRGIDVHAIDRNGISAFHSFMTNAENYPREDLQEMQLVRDKFRQKSDNHNTVDNRGNSILHTIARYDHLVTAPHLLENAIHVARHENMLNAKNYDGDTALHIAVKQFFLEIDSKNTIGALLANGADPNEKNALGQTPLDFVVALPYTRNSYYSQAQHIGMQCEMIEALVSHGARLSESTQALIYQNEDFQAAYHQGFLGRNEEAMTQHRRGAEREAEHRRIPPSTTNGLGETPLIQFIKYQYDGDVMHQIRTATTIVASSITDNKGNNYTTMELNATDHAGRNALHYAVMAHHLPAARALIAAGINVNQADCHGSTAMDYALRYPVENTPEMVKLLALHRAKYDPESLNFLPASSPIYHRTQIVLQEAVEWSRASRKYTAILVNKMHEDGFPLTTGKQITDLDNSSTLASDPSYVRLRDNPPHLPANPIATTVAATSAPPSAAVGKKRKSEAVLADISNKPPHDDQSHQQTPATSSKDITKKRGREGAATEDSFAKRLRSEPQKSVTDFEVDLRPRRLLPVLRNLGRSTPSR